MKEYIRLIPVAGLQINIYLCTAFFLSAALHADTLPDCGKEGKKLYKNRYETIIRYVTF